MRLIGNGLAQTPPKLNRTTSGRVSSVCTHHLLRRIDSLTPSCSRAIQWHYPRGPRRYLQQLPRLHRELVPLPDYQPTTVNSLPAQIDWQPEVLTWLIDGSIVRTLNRSDTINSNGVALYPSTPARIQIRCNSLLLFLVRTELIFASPR